MMQTQRMPAARVPIRSADDYLSMLEDLCAAIDTYMHEGDLMPEVRALYEDANRMLEEAPLKDE